MGGRGAAWSWWQESSVFLGGVNNQVNNISRWGTSQGPFPGVHHQRPRQPPRLLHRVGNPEDIGGGGGRGGSAW